VVDGHTGQIIQSYKADEARFPASITKVMTLYMVFEFIKKKRVSMDTALLVTEHAASQSPTKLNLKAGDTILLKDAVRALITKSANDAAAAIAENLAGSEAAFARLMTTRARMLGMKNTTFRNASGLPHPDQRTTAYDLAVLARATLHNFPEHASLFRTRFFKYGKRLYKNHNGLLFTYPGVTGMKTGFTNASGFNLATTAERDGKHLIAVVLGGRSSRHRNRQMTTLLDASWSRAKTKAEHQEEMRLVAAARDKRRQEFAAAQKARLAVAQAAAKPQKAVEVAQKPQLQTASPISKPVAPAPIRLAAAVHVQPAPRPQPAPEVTYFIQVGAYETAANAQARLLAVQREAGDALAGRGSIVEQGHSGGRTVMRARFGPFTHTGAHNACEALRIRAIDCMIAQP
jgi:D-alanyl-D-alanine carboxypeptidase